MLQQRRATAAAAAHDIRLRAATAQRDRPSEGGRKEASSRGNAADSGREGNSFAGKTNH